MSIPKELFAHVFREGCGQDVERVVTSERYRELVTQEQGRIATYPETSDLGLALRAGHVDFGMRMPTAMSEHEAIAWAKEHAPSTPKSDPHERALIRLLGEDLITAAQEGLPEELHALAATWHDRDAEGQKEILQEVYRWFGEFVETYRDRVPDYEGDRPLRWDEIIRMTYTAEQALPRSIGSLTDPTVRPNCLGLMMYIAAFGRLCNAELMLCSPMLYAADAMWKSLEVFAEGVKRILEDTFLERDIDPVRYYNRLSYVHLMLGDAKRNFGVPRGFHRPVAFRLADGSWFHVDPYQQNFAPMGHVLSQYTQETHETLMRFDPVLPGLVQRYDILSVYETNALLAVENVRLVVEQGDAFMQRAREYPAGLMDPWSVEYALMELYGSWIAGDFSDEEDVLDDEDDADDEDASAPGMHETADDAEQDSVEDDFIQEGDDALLEMLAQTNEMREIEDVHSRFVPEDDQLAIPLMDSFDDDLIVLNFGLASTTVTAGEPMYPTGERDFERGLFSNLGISTFFEAWIDVVPEDEVLEVEWFETITEGILDDDEYRERQMERFVFASVAQELRKTHKELQILDGEEAPLPHPLMELSLVEFNLALSALNHVRLWTDNDIAGSVLLEHSSSQVFWHNAVDLSKGETVPELGDAVLRAEALVRKQKAKYPVVDIKLEELTRRRAEEGESDDEETDAR